MENIGSIGNIGLNTTMSSSDKFLVENEVNNFNKQISLGGRVQQQQLGKDEFLKLLITQLSNQDPTAPMEDTQFISQMAQFSSLEQMTNMNEGFKQLSAMMNGTQAANTLGRTVDIDLGDDVLTGVVDATTFGENPQVQVNGMYYDMNKIKALYN